MLGPGPRLIKKNLPGRGLTKLEKHCPRVFVTLTRNTMSVIYDVKSPSFYCVMPYGLVDGYQSFGGVYCFKSRRQQS